MLILVRVWLVLRQPLHEGLAHRGAYFYQGIITPAIMEMRFGFWEKAVSKFEAIQDKDSLYCKQAMDYKTAFSYFSAGMLALEKNNIDSAIINLDKLDALFWRSSQLENEKVIKNLSFKINNGEKIAIVGRSGSGKTNLLNLISQDMRQFLTQKKV